jgi:hypothetical protein
VPARSSNSVRWVLSTSLSLLAVLWLLVGCGAHQDAQEENQQEGMPPIEGEFVGDWFTTTVSGDAFQVSGDSGMKLYASLAPELAIGTIVLPNGDPFDFEIPQASGIDGVYPLIVPPESGELSSTSWSGAQLAGTRDGEEITGIITTPDSDAEAFGFGFSVAATEEGADRWIAVTSDDGQPRIKGAKIAGD